VIDQGVEVAFDFFALGMLFMFVAAVMFGAVAFMRRMIG
jgi:hypothetical protein